MEKYKYGKTSKKVETWQVYVYLQKHLFIPLRCEVTCHFFIHAKAVTLSIVIVLMKLLNPPFKHTILNTIEMRGGGNGIAPA